MNRGQLRKMIFTIGATTLIFGGCARSKPTKFYILTPSPSSEPTSHEPLSAKQLVLRVGPIDFPEYLDRPQIVSRTKGNRLRLAEFDRWAEPLRQTFARALTENLSGALATERVVFLPWKGDGPVDYRITIEVLRFDCSPGGEASLIVRWTLFGPDGTELEAPRRSRIMASTRQTGYEGVADAMSEAVGTLSREVVAAIRSHR